MSHAYPEPAHALPAIGPSFDHLVGERDQRLRNVKPSGLAVLRLITSTNMVGGMTGKLAGISTFESHRPPQ